MAGDETHMTVFSTASGRQRPRWNVYAWDINRADLEFVRPFKPVE
jgi:hypothetical protein